MEYNPALETEPNLLTEDEWAALNRLPGVAVTALLILLTLIQLLGPLLDWTYDRWMQNEK